MLSNEGVCPSSDESHVSQVHQQNDGNNLSLCSVGSGEHFVNDRDHQKLPDSHSSDGRARRYSQTTKELLWTKAAFNCEQNILL